MGHEDEKKKDAGRAPSAGVGGFLQGSLGSDYQTSLNHQVNLSNDSAFRNLKSPLAVDNPFTEILVSREDARTHFDIWEEGGLGAAFAKASGDINNMSTIQNEWDRYHDGGSFTNQLQVLLWQAGYVDADHIPSGNPFDPNYQTAVHKVLAIAESNPDLPYLELLQKQAAWNSGRSGRDGTGRAAAPPPKPKVISEEDAEELLSQVSKQEMGRTLTESERAVANAIIKRVRDQSRDEQQQQINDVMAGRTSTNPTSERTITKNQLREEKGAEANSYRFVNAVGSLAQVVRGRF